MDPLDLGTGHEHEPRLSDAFTIAAAQAAINAALASSGPSAPAQAQPEQPAPPAGEPLKRGRGRPKKMAGVAAGGSDGVEGDVRVAPEGTGKPPPVLGPDGQKRGPGRPRKSDEQKELDRAEKLAKRIAAGAGQKKRGRPLGSKVRAASSSVLCAALTLVPTRPLAEQARAQGRSATQGPLDRPACGAQGQAPRRAPAQGHRP